MQNKLFNYKHLKKTQETNRLKTYLDTYTSDWKMKDPDDITAEVDFDQEANAVLLWAKKIS